MPINGKNGKHYIPATSADGREIASTCDSQRHRPTWTVSSLTESMHLECHSGRRRWLVLWWQSQGLTLCARAALCVCVLQSYETVFRRIFDYVAVWKLLNQNWRHFLFVEPLTFDRSQSASASSDLMALYKWFYRFSDFSDSTTPKLRSNGETSLLLNELLYFCALPYLHRLYRILYLVARDAYTHWILLLLFLLFE